ncbi:MAG TPA: hypothetical protein VFI73_04575 [Candidatus Nitrosopolaris sp.]|nr:hypothetical protein [Candidatus Nitrosopolaris sp.]
MGEFIPELISMLLPTERKKVMIFHRKPRMKLFVNKKVCAVGGVYITRWERDSHHKDGNKSIDKLT